jgi:dipeptidyl aminopeptidase/acylaminoacyl peptidase
MNKEDHVSKQPQTESNAVWKQRFRASGLWWAELARQARSRGIAISAASGTGQLYAWDVPSGPQRQLTHRQEGVFTGYLAPDGSHVYYLHDEGGSETGHYVRVPWEGGPAQDLTPDMPAYAALYRCAVNDTGTVFAFTPTEADGFPLYVVDLHPDGTASEPRELYRSPKLIDDVALSYDAEIAVIATSEHSRARQYSLLAVALADGRQVGTLSDLPQGSVRAAMFSPLPGDQRLLGTADRSGHTRPLIWDLANGERADLPLGDLAGDVEPLDWSLDGRRILLRQIAQAAQRLYAYDLETATLTPLRHQGGTYITAQFGPQGQVIALWSDSTHLPQVIALDGATGAEQCTLLAAGETPPARPFTSVSFRSSDGVEIQGWLGLPPGDGPFPTILATHGGPHVAAEAIYDPEGQAWLDHGYAYLSINYRGSTTFGREFKEKVWGDMGNWEVEDMVAARNWLLESGIAQPEAILVTGASYGGYLTLMALGKRPDLWAGGMAVVSPADFTSEFYDGTDWSRGYLTAMMGGTPEEKPEQYAASSPITYAAQVQAPLLVIQGRNDLRCPPRQMELYTEKMRSLDKPFEIDWFDAGHGGLETEHIIGFQERMLEFAHRVLQNRNK